MNIDELIAGLGLSDEQKAQLTQNLATIELSRLQGLQSDVARAEEGSIMTRAGLDILTRGIAGEKIIYTRVGIGDSWRNGTLIEPTDKEILDFTDLINWREDIPIADARFSGGGTMVVQGVLMNEDFREGFWLRELGLYAKIEGDEHDVLYSYRNSGVLSPYQPSGKGAVLVNLVLNLVTVVDNATNITALIDARLLYVSQAQHLDHVNSYTPHPNIPKLKDALTSTPALWANDNDNELHPITVDDLTEQILSDDAAPISRLSSRVSQNETNIANLYMQLDSVLEVGLDANLLVFEDFDDCKCVDMLKTKVLATAGGPSDLYVEDLTGILIGHYYTVSDGTRSQLLRVKAVACNDGLFNVMFEEQITKTFNLAKTYLRRTTGVIENGNLSGSGSITETAVTLDDVWTGVANSVTKNLSLTTTQKHTANFELSGDYAFNSSGFFTLA